MFQSLWLLALLIFPICNSTTDTLTPIQSLRERETLISAGEVFALGFFSPGNSKNRYVGIWFNKIPEQQRTVVWVANRENPVQNSYGALLTIKGGNLVLVDGGQQRNNTLWSANVSTFANISSATLTDSGNLILRDDHERVLWESFDYPTNTHLPNMKLGLNLRTGLNRVLTSWKSPDDPAAGEFSLGLDRRGMPQFFLRQGSNPIWRSGPWVGERFSGVPVRSQDLAYTNRYVATDEEIYSVYNWNQTEKIIMSIVHDSGVYQWLLWSDKNGRWIPLYVNVRDRCDRYANCGAFGICDANSAAECTCLRGFEPRHPGDWNWRDWSGGCVRRKPLNCGGKGDDGFLKVESVKVPDTSSSRVEPSWSLKECAEECLKSCNCTAYATANISEGSGCVIWYGKLVDIKVYSELDQGQDLYTRVAASELDETSYRRSRSFRAKKKLLVTILIVISVVLSSYFCSHYWWKKAKGRKMNERQDTIFNDDDMPNDGEDSGLQLFNFGVILAATDNFSESNLLGKGGFGPVYKGELVTGQEIAVKRLSKNSGQGTEEFNNEVTLIAKLQHRNLVRLLGCCITGQERILVYEYMRNKSLDSLLFDPTRREMLNWEKRFNIIVGIARGILYLHEDSRFRIIHRDLKVSNILLDDNLNPKISDFGTARIFGGNQTQAKTRRVVGTYGYMSPEYAIGGLFSVKSDAFSFGVILLEIISGKRNNYCSDCQSMNLIGYVWELWKEDRVLEIVDSSMSISDFESEVLRCIQVGLLCVQGKPNDRPTMSSVVFMLGNETMMPSPNQPPPCFLKENCFDSQHSSSNRTRCCSKNEVSITKMEGR